MGDVIHAETRFNPWMYSPPLTLADIRKAYVAMKRGPLPLTENEKKILRDAADRKMMRSYEGLPRWLSSQLPKE